MPKFEVRVCTKGGENFADETERMAVNRFCELLGQDASDGESRFPVGTEIVLNDLENRIALLRYIVGYE